MSTGYFEKVQRQTPTRFWINNPTMAEMEQAIAGGRAKLHHQPHLLQPPEWTPSPTSSGPSSTPW